MAEGGSGNLRDRSGDERRGGRVGNPGRDFPERARLEPEETEEEGWHDDERRPREPEISPHTGVAVQEQRRHGDDRPRAGKMSPRAAAAAAAAVEAAAPLTLPCLGCHSSATATHLHSKPLPDTGVNSRGEGVGEGGKHQEHSKEEDIKEGRQITKE